MEVRFTLDDKIASDMLQQTTAGTASEMCRESLHLLRWSINETNKGRQIQSYNSIDESVRIPVMSIFDFGRGR